MPKPSLEGEPSWPWPVVAFTFRKQGVPDNERLRQAKLPREQQSHPTPVDMCKEQVTLGVCNGRMQLVPDAKAQVNVRACMLTIRRSEAECPTSGACAAARAQYDPVNCIVS